LSYDPGSNPRFLGEEIEEDRDYTSSLNAEIERWDRVLDTFRSEGWKVIQAQLESETKRAEKALRMGRFESMDQLNLVRGQLMGYEQLLQLPQVARGAHRRLTEQLETHMMEVESEP
jgi:hypothetical protein